MQPQQEQEKVAVLLLRVAGEDQPGGSVGGTHSALKFSPPG